MASTNCQDFGNYFSGLEFIELTLVHSSHPQEKVFVPLHTFPGGWEQSLDLLKCILTTSTELVEWEYFPMPKDVWTLT